MESPNGMSIFSTELVSATLCQIPQLSRRRISSTYLACLSVVTNTPSLFFRLQHHSIFHLLCTLRVCLPKVGYCHSLHPSSLRPMC
ncbi:hypothetical protein K474DRAFT_1669506 [Panus rudis PR-1116 ss-1]|nr:hypothetical protein K474DRAFT_1669506 [Panus rudis PR-1116 ss-1]